MTDQTEAAGGADGRMGSEVTIAQAAQWREQLLAWLSDGRTSLALDLSEVADFDSAGVQLILATRRSLAERGGTLSLRAASATVADALRVFGLQDCLGERSGSPAA